MISILLLFFFSCLVSFVGSLQLGPVNLFVIHTALKGDKKSAYLVALGGCVPEFIYCSLAVFANTYLLKLGWLIYFFKIGFLIILITLGFMYFFKKHPNALNKENADLKGQSQQGFFKGFSLAILNPQLLPFWILIQVYFNSIQFLRIHSSVQKISFILGSGIGAFILLAVLIYLVLKYRDSILNYMNNSYYYKALSLLFFLLAIHQLWLLSH